MKQLFSILLALSALAGCIQDTEAYVLDGVPIVLEYGEGPEREHMALAASLFREGATDYWGLEDDVTVWRSLREIRWTAASLEEKVLYRADQNVLYVNWYDCALDVPLYIGFAEHYGIMLGTFENPADREWAEALQNEHQYEVCDSDGPRRLGFPW